MANSGGRGNDLHPIIAAGCNRSTIRIATPSTRIRQPPAMMGYRVRAGGFQMCGPDHPGQGRNVPAGQDMPSSTVQMHPGSLDVGRRRRPWPATLDVPPSLSQFPRRAYHFTSCHPPHGPYVFIPFASVISDALFCLRLRNADPLSSDAVSFALERCTSLAFRCPWLPCPEPAICFLKLVCGAPSDHIHLATLRVRHGSIGCDTLNEHGDASCEG